MMWKPTRWVPAMLLLAIAGFLTTRSASAAPLLQSGSGLSRLRVSPDGHFLERSDGVPVFWMGDTAWHLPKLSNSDIELYLSDTAQKGFNGVLIDLTYYYFEQLGEPPFLDSVCCNADPDVPNEAYWQKVDWLVGQAEARGLYTALVVMWSYHYPLAF